MHNFPAVAFASCFSSALDRNSKRFEHIAHERYATEEYKLFQLLINSHHFVQTLLHLLAALVT